MRASVLVTAVLIVGCSRAHDLDAGFDATPPPVDGGAFVNPAVHDFLDERARLLCRLDINCGDPHGHLEASSAPSFFERFCHPRLAARSVRDASSTEAERIAAGRSRFDAEAAATCLAALRAREQCPPMGVWELCLFAPFEPIRELGGACDWASDECGPDLYCDPASCMCQPALPLGAPCDDWDCSGGDSFCARSRDSCLDGAECGRAIHTCELEPGLGTPCEHGLDCGWRGWAGELVCFEGTCQQMPESRIGDPCASGTLLEGPMCGNGLLCGWVMTERVCVAGLTEGEACAYFDCADHLACVDSICVPRHLDGEPCVPVERRDGCDASAPWCVDSFCSADPEGAGCRSWAVPPEEDSCPAGFRCSERERPSQDVCLRLVDYGDACDEPQQCPFDARCVEGRCLRVVMPDLPCGPDATCSQMHTCLDALCVPRPLEGEPCDESLPCLYRVCVDGVCARLPVGAPCERGWDCEGECSGVCEPPGEEGDDCLSSACGAGLECDGFHCAPGCPG